MISSVLSSFENLGLYANVQIPLGGGLYVTSDDVIMFAFFVVALVNIWFALKFLIKKVF